MDDFPVDYFDEFDQSFMPQEFDPVVDQHEEETSETYPGEIFS